MMEKLIWILLFGVIFVVYLIFVIGVNVEEGVVFELIIDFYVVGIVIDVIE